MERKSDYYGPILPILELRAKSRRWKKRIIHQILNMANGIPTRRSYDLIDVLEKRNLNSKGMWIQHN